MKILIVLLLFSGNCYSQITWDFNLWFNLSDKKGQEIVLSDFNNVEIYSPYGTHINSKIEYDTIVNMYKYSVNSALPISMLLFVYNSDTTLIEMRSDGNDFVIESLTLDGEHYDFTYNTTDLNQINCKKKLRGYQNKFVCQATEPLSTYRVEKILKQDVMNLENNWEEVKLE